MIIVILKRLSSKYQFKRLSRFFLVGIVGCFIDFLFTWILKEIASVNPYIANSIGFILAVVNNFVLNRILTFKDSGSSVSKQMSLFFLISLLGLAINLFFLYFFISLLGWAFYFSKLSAVGIGFFWNYFLNSFFTFKSEKGFEKLLEGDE